VRILSLLFLLCVGLLSSGQRIGPCPPSPPRSAVDVKELKGVVVDENLAVIPKVTIKLQVSDGDGIRDIATTETDAVGQFRFGAQPFGKYYLAFKAPNFCPATIPIRYSRTGLKGVRLTLPVAASDSCPQDCDTKVKVEEMTGREGHL